MKNKWLDRLIFILLLILGITIGMAKLEQVSRIQRQMLFHAPDYLVHEENPPENGVFFNITSSPDTILQDKKFIIQIADELEATVFHIRADGRDEEVGDPSNWEKFVYQPFYPTAQGIQGNPFVRTIPSSTVNENTGLIAPIELLEQKYYSANYDQFSFYSLENLEDYDIPPWLSFQILYPKGDKLAPRLVNYFDNRISILSEWKYQAKHIDIPLRLGPIWVSFLLLASLLIFRLTQASREIAIGYIQGETRLDIFNRVFGPVFILGSIWFGTGLFVTGFILGRGFSPAAIYYYRSLITVMGYFTLGILLLAGIFLLIIATFERQMDSFVRTGISLRRYPLSLSTIKVIGLIVLIPILAQSVSQIKSLNQQLKYFDSHPEAAEYFGLYSMAFYSQPEVGVDENQIIRADQERIRQMGDVMAVHQPMYLNVTELMMEQIDGIENVKSLKITVNHNFAAKFLNEIYPTEAQRDSIYFVHPKDFDSTSQSQMIEMLRPHKITYQGSLELDDPLLRLQETIRNPSVWILPDNMLETSVFFPETFFLPDISKEALMLDLSALSTEPNLMFMDNSFQIEKMRQQRQNLRNQALIDTSFSLISLLTLSIAIIQMASYSQKKRIAVAAMLASPKQLIYGALMILLALGNFIALVWMLTINRGMAGDGIFFLIAILVFSLMDGLTLFQMIRRMEHSLLPTILNQQGS